MFGLFRRGSGRGGGKPSLDAVRFDPTGYAARGEPQPGRVRVWHTPEDAASVEELAAFYRLLLGDSGGKLVEVGVAAAGGCPAVRTLLAVPQQPSGRTYVGSLTVPFRDFSFVIKCQCEEGGPTGLKEALLVDRSRAAGEPMQIEGRRFHIPGWNPDDPRHDAEFPNHPVARARRVLAHVAGTLVIADEVRQLPGFALPQRTD
jgi:hypothetical protein